VRNIRGGSFLVYQRTDKYEEYNSQTAQYLLSAHRLFLKDADLVVYASKALYQEESQENRPSLLIGHAVDLARFDPDNAREAGLPSDLSNVAHPIVGYFGEFEDFTIDMDLVEATAEALPDVSIVIVGRTDTDTKRFRNIKNMHFCGKKPYEEVPRYGV